MASNEEAMEKLAGAMEKLADRIEKFQDPVLWQKVLSDAMGIGMLQPPQIARLAPLPPTEGAPAMPIGWVEEITIRLSDEERTAMAQRVYEAVQPQLQEFQAFVKASLEEMPPHRLKELAKKIEQGKEAKLKRRHGCLFVALDSGEEYYLGL